MSFSTCKYCGARIVWAQMPAGNYLPMDPDYGGLHECVSFSRSDGYSSTWNSGGARWDPLSDPGPLTIRTTCWWCGESVYFHRAENGGCVLFDELGRPWAVHSCWKEYAGTASARAAQSDRIREDLEYLEYTGTWYVSPRRTRRRPEDPGKTDVVHEGYISDNRALENTPYVARLPSCRRASTMDLSEVGVSFGSFDALPVLVPLPKAIEMPDYALVRVRASWLKRGRRWALLARSVSLLDERGGTERILRNLLSAGRSCYACGDDGEGHWGITDDGHRECARCGEARGKLSRSEFLTLCRDVVRKNGAGR